MDLALQIILILLFDSYRIYYIVISVLYIVGVAFILKKSGLKWYFALIPWFREYQLSRCAYREPEGRIYCILSFLYTLFAVLASVFDKIDNYNQSYTIFTYLYMIFVVTVVLALVIYNIRVFNGFIQLYGVSKLWIVFGLGRITSFIPFLIWGLSKRYQPKMKVEDINIEISEIKKHGSSGDINDGLSVNIASRHVFDFFKKKYLLKDINMNIPAGHMVLLLGGSGAGKTTFINAVNGFEKADAEIMLDGQNLYTNYNKMKHNVGFVPQPQMMRDKDTVRMTLYDAAEIRLSKDISRSDKIARVNEVMEIFGLLPIQDNLVQKLSGGQKKRLSISMELLSNPALFILDEPDSGLDGVMARELFSRLREVANDNKIVIVITHSPDRVVDFFDDVIVLAKDKTRTGRLAFYGSIDEARNFFNKESMEEIVKTVNLEEEGGDGEADKYIEMYSRMVQNG